MEKGLNTELYWKNNDPTHTVSMVPTSAITGEGIPDLLLWLVKLTQVTCAIAGIPIFRAVFLVCRFRERTRLVALETLIFMKGTMMGLDKQ